MLLTVILVGLIAPQRQGSPKCRSRTTSGTTSPVGGSYIDELTPHFLEVITKARNISVALVLLVLVLPPLIAAGLEQLCELLLCESLHLYECES